MKKYLLCIPNGGFADNIKVISRCASYADKYKRSLIIDTKTGSLRRDFSDYFRFLGNEAEYSLRLTEDDKFYLNKMSAFPSGVEGRVGQITPKGVWIHDNYGYSFVDKDLNFELTFDFEAEYEQDVLYHLWYGVTSTPDINFSFLWRLTLTQHVKKYIFDRISKLPSRYIAIHLRNTDKKVDYRDFISSISSKLSCDDVLVCSDNAQTIRDVRMMLPDMKIHQVIDVPDTLGDPIHNYGTVWKYGLDHDALNKDMLVDLFALSGAAELYFPLQSVQVGDGGKLILGGSKSGFSELSNYLHQNISLRAQLLGY